MSVRLLSIQDKINNAPSTVRVHYPSASFKKEVYDV